MIEKVIHKTIRDSSLYKVKERIKYAESTGYKLIGEPKQISTSSWHALMSKTIYWEERE